MRSARGPIYQGGALGHAAARSHSVTLAGTTAPGTTAGPLARSFARAVPTPHQRRPLAMAARGADLDLAAPTAPLSTPGAAEANASISRAAATPRQPALAAPAGRPAGAARRVSPASRALGRMAATVAPGRTTPLAGTPAARAVARFGAQGSFAPSGLSRTRSLTASAELGMLPPLRRSAAAAGTDTVLAAPFAHPAAARSADTATASSRAPRRFASPSSPVARAFARTGEGAPAGHAGGRVAAAIVPGAQASRSAQRQAGIAGFDPILPSMHSTATRAAQPGVTGPGRGFSLARRAHRERSAASAFVPGRPQLSLDVASASRKGEATGAQALRTATSQPPGARLVARSAAARWSTGEANLELAAPSLGSAAARSTAPSAGGVSSASAVSVRRSRHVASGGLLSAIAAPGRAIPASRSSDQGPRRGGPTPLSRLLGQSPDLLPGAAARAAQSTAVTASPGRRAAGASAEAAPARRSSYGRGSRSAELLSRVAQLKPGESIEATDEPTLADAGAMVAEAARQFDPSQPTSRGRRAPAGGQQALRREGLASRSHALVDATQLESLVRKELDTLSAPKPSINEAEVVRLAREALASHGLPAIARAAKGSAPGGEGGAQKDLDDLLHRLIRRMLIEEQIGGERALNS